MLQERRELLADVLLQNEKPATTLSVGLIDILKQLSQHFVRPQRPTGPARQLQRATSRCSDRWERASWKRVQQHRASPLQQRHEPPVLAPNRYRSLLGFGYVCDDGRLRVLGVLADALVVVSEHIGADVELHQKTLESAPSRKRVNRFGRMCRAVMPEGIE